MPSTPKDVEIKARVTPDMKTRVEAVAEERGESTSVIVREALQSYLANKGISVPAKEKSKTSEEPTKYKVGPRKKPSKGASTKKEFRSYLSDIYEASIYCDIPAGWAEDRQTVKPKRTVRLSKAQYQPGIFGLDVRGESMNAAKGKIGPIHAGDTVLLVPFTTACEASGKIVAANIDGRTTLKRMVCPKDGSDCYLRPESTLEEFAGTMHALHEITVLGVVVGKL